MHISFDDGEHWQSFQQNLPHTPITDIAVHDDDLVLSTQGRSFWVLEDLSPIHQMDKQVMNSASHLFNPNIAYRMQFRGYAGSPGPDPYPTGALVYFYLDEESSEEPVKLDILDESGDVIRSFSTDTADTKERNRLAVSEGLNRFEWDLNHEGPFVVNNLVTMVIGNPPRGPEAVPGTYSVRLSIGDQQQEKSFELKADPRWDVSADDLRQTYELADEIAGMITNFQRAIEQIRSVREQVTSVVKKKSNIKQVQDQAAELNEKLTKLEDLFINNKIESGQDPIGMERRLSNRMGRLYQVVRDHDAQPTKGMQERFADLEKVYADYLEQYRELMDSDLASFNRLLKDNNVNHIIVE
jgi:hypothetical protein